MKGQGAESSGLVARDVWCSGCGYNLRTLPLTGRCPECGSEVRASLGAHRETGALRAGITAFARGFLITSTAPVGIGLATAIDEIGLLLAPLLVSGGLFFRLWGIYRLGQDRLHLASAAQRGGLWILRGIVLAEIALMGAAAAYTAIPSLAGVYLGSHSPILAAAAGHVMGLLGGAVFVNLVRLTANEIGSTHMNSGCWGAQVALVTAAVSFGLLYAFGVGGPVREMAIGLAATIGLTFVIAVWLVRSCGAIAEELRWFRTQWDHIVGWATTPADADD